MTSIRRKSGKYTPMSSAVSCSRLRQLQAILKDGGNNAPDAILCSLGIDSRYNEGCTELANYLFFGLYRHNQLDLDHISDDLAEEVLDDVILLIKAESVHLYCNPENYGYLLPYVDHWRNLHLHCMTETEYEDEEAAEEFKISSFVSMVQDCSRIGIPYSSQGHVQTFDMFMLEKWAIIQAFALEGIGAGGFFTMKYKLMDVSQRVWQTYARLDPVSLDRLITEDLALFERQWSSFFASLNIETQLSMQELSEAVAGEAFRTYFSHGLISSNISDKSKSWQPFALFGSHSSMEEIQSYCFTFPSEGHQIRNTGSHGASSKHMVLQCVAPKGPLACARTYFFGTTHVPYLGNDNVQQKSTELLLLSQIYAAAVQAVLSGIKCFSYNSSITKAKDVAGQTFQRNLDSFGLTQYRNALRSKAVFSIRAVNNEGRVVPLSQPESRFLLKTASMSVYDIPDLQRAGTNLGSVIFSESFLESSIYIQDKEGAISSDSCYTILTSSVPRYVSWLVEDSDVKLSEQAQQLLKAEEGTCLGTLLAVGDSAQVFSSSPLCTPEEGKLVFFSEGLLFVHPQYGAVTLSKNHIKGLKLYDGDSLSKVSVLYVEYESSLLPYLPFHLQSKDHCLGLALLHNTKSYRSLYSQVLQVWHGPDSTFCLQMVDAGQLSEEQMNMYSRLQILNETPNSSALKQRVVLKTAYPDLPELDRFRQHFALCSSVCDEPVNIDHLEALFPNTHISASLPEKKHKVVVSVITGLPGSHTESLCDFLLSLNQESNRWVVYRPSPDTIGFSACHLQQFLSKAVENQKQKEQRVLLITPGNTDVLEVVQCVVSHPDPVVRSSVRVGAVTACVNPLSSYMEHRFFFPKLLEQCSQGVVSNVVFTGLTEQKHPLLQHVQQLVRSANPNTAFILADRGAVTRTADMRFILSENSFSEAHMIRARYLLYPGWAGGKFACGSASLSIAQIRLQFSQPLERSLFLLHCKALKSSLKTNPFKGNIYHLQGTVRFSDSSKLMEVCLNTLTGNLTLVEKAPSGDSPCPPSALLFHGVGLAEDGLKDWLRLCAKQKLMKKVRKTHKSLSPQELRIIHVSRHLDPLPPGHFYNGRQYVSFFGEKSTLHPSMEQFIEEYLQEANKEIERFNRELELKDQRDLFDP
ncbi:dynein axonemal assembly factor 9 [Clupea harengus]|uniref:Dynein axonemal assembly factor 9 n=1 Tax=Clupea harengus TaxID=7950 RepID=A0A6P8G8C0_CLUHA|nr:dynein axonemal assembly factor 9 [Clupea harengus]